MQKRSNTPKKDSDEAIKKRIKEAISSKNLKIKQFARESGMAYPSLRDYYSGLRKPGFDAISALLDFTGVNGDWLLLGQGSMFPEATQKRAKINEIVLGKISQQIELGFQDTETNGLQMVQDEDAEEYAYSPKTKDDQAKLNRIGENSIMAASIYNRVAHLTDEDELAKAIREEVRTQVRLAKASSQLMF